MEKYLLMERYKLSLVCAVVKKAKASEKAFICLKSGWLMRGWKENLQENGGDAKKIEELQNQEEEYLQNAYKGFIEARQSEGFPMCGMDEVTIDYLVAVLATNLKKYDVASRLVSSILASGMANARVPTLSRSDVQISALLCFPGMSSSICASTSMGHTKYCCWKSCWGSRYVLPWKIPHICVPAVF